MLELLVGFDWERTEEKGVSTCTRREKIVLLFQDLRVKDIMGVLAQSVPRYRYVPMYVVDKSGDVQG